MAKNPRFIKTALILSIVAAVCFQFSFRGEDDVQVNAPLPKPTQPVPPLDLQKPNKTQVAVFGLG